MSDVYLYGEDDGIYIDTYLSDQFGLYDDDDVKRFNEQCIRLSAVLEKRAAIVRERNLAVARVEAKANIEKARVKRMHELLSLTEEGKAALKYVNGRIPR